MKDEQHPVVSRTTILIVAGVLIAVSARGLKPYSVDFACMVAGLLGLMAYLLLEYGAYRRLHERYSVARALQQLERNLQAQVEQAQAEQDEQAPSVPSRTNSHQC